MQGFFAIVGAQRCGTTSLCRTLDQHPQIQMARPVRPEPKFFISEEFQRGRAYYLETYFAGKRGCVLGEKSTSYIERPGSWERMKSFFPDARAIVLLRDPVERALSNYRFSVVNGLESRTLEDVFLREKPIPQEARHHGCSVDPLAYLQRGSYSKYLRELDSVFGKGRYAAYVFERFTAQPSAVREVFEFLGLPDAELAYGPRVNASAHTKEVPDAVYEKLRAYYAPELRRLEEWIDVSAWQT